MKLKCVEPGHWESEDGRVKMWLDETFETECDAPHPVRMLTEKLTKREARNVLATTRGRFTTWLCPGGETHFYAMWTTEVDGEWLDDVHYKFTEAVAAAEEAVGEKLTLGRTRRPKPNPVVDLATEILKDELEGVNAFLASAEETLRGPDAMFMDMDLFRRNKRRKAELEALLATAG